MPGVRVETNEQCVEQRGQPAQRERLPHFVDRCDQPRHVRTFALGRQRDIRPECRYRRLRYAVTVLETNGIAQAADADPIDRELADIRVRLDVGDGGDFRSVHR